MKKLRLDKEEQEILEAFEKGSLKSVPHVASEIKRYQNMAKAQGNKVKRINLRMTAWDYEKAQEKALREGLPYQTFLSSVLHKYLTGQLVEQH